MVYSELECLRENLVFDLASSSKGDLSSFERLYIIQHLSFLDKINQRWLVDLYMKCGCFSEAMDIFGKLGHWRKLGDLAWIQGDLSKAERCYSKGEDRNGAVFRGYKDWDRLIKLYFLQSRWQSVIDTTLEANLFPLGEEQIVLGSSSVSSKPYLRMAAIAVSKANKADDPVLVHKITDAFSQKRQEWQRLLDVASTIPDDELSVMQDKCALHVIHTRPITLVEAMEKGSTEKADNIVSLITDLETTSLRAKDAIVLFFKTKSLSELDRLFDILAGFSDESLCKTFISSIISNTYNLFKDQQDPELITQFYESHPLIKRMYFGELLLLKFTKCIPINPSDIYTGLLQHISSVETDINSFRAKSIKKNSVLEFDKIICFSDWVEMKIGSWLTSDGNQRLATTIAIWNSGKAVQVQSPFSPGKHYPQNPREMLEWKSLLNECHKYLSNCWQSEIGLERWLSEKALYETINQRFKGYEIIRHAEPIWLEPQHLDVYIPELSVAIEYMGEQHYRPVDYFGGTTGFEATTLRDKHKAVLCSKVGIELFYVRFDDDMKTKVDELSDKFV